MRGSQPWRTNRARVLRDTQSSAEARLWERVRDCQLGGFKFVRQASIRQFFADFACRERKLVVEIDGGTHSSDAEATADAHRDAELAKLGYRVIRVGNDEVYDNIDGVLETLLAELKIES
jgi:very-short-patch-repair endonuclease